MYAFLRSVTLTLTYGISLVPTTSILDRSYEKNRRRARDYLGLPLLTSPLLRDLVWFALGLSYEEEIVMASVSESKEEFEERLEVS